jgi:hypothetical protein
MSYIVILMSFQTIYSINYGLEHAYHINRPNTHKIFEYA